MAAVADTGSDPSPIAIADIGPAKTQALSSAASLPDVGNGGTSITGWFWKIVAAPSGSSVEFVDSGTDESTIASPVLTSIDTWGNYRVMLVVEDDAGNSSSPDAPGTPVPANQDQDKAFVVVRVESAEGLQKPAAGERNWSGLAHDWVTEIDDLRTDVDAAATQADFSNHSARHADGGADELKVEDLATSSSDTTKFFRPDGSGGVELAVPSVAVPDPLTIGHINATSVDVDTISDEGSGGIDVTPTSGQDVRFNVASGGALKVDKIEEKTGSNGVDIEDLTILDNDINGALDADLTITRVATLPLTSGCEVSLESGIVAIRGAASGSIDLKTDGIYEDTSDAGVTVEDVLLKDGIVASDNTTYDITADVVTNVATYTTLQTVKTMADGYLQVGDSWDLKCWLELTSIDTSVDVDFRVQMGGNTLFEYTGYTVTDAGGYEGNMLTLSLSGFMKANADNVNVLGTLFNATKGASVAVDAQKGLAVTGAQDITVDISFSSASVDNTVTALGTSFVIHRST